MAAESKRRPPPLWLGNLIAFALLIALALGWFSLQSHQAQQRFRDEAARQVGLLAEVVGLHARGVVRAQAVTDDILSAFLGNAARFVAYLDWVEPFESDELTAFAAESGLSVIRVIRDQGMSQGPADWDPGAPLNCEPHERLLSLVRARTLVLSVPRNEGAGCVLVGMDSRRMDELRKELGMRRALSALEALPGVRRAVLETGGKVNGENATVRLRRLPDAGAVAETRTPVADGWLLLDLDADAWLVQEAGLWRDFLWFALLLGLLGGVGTWVLYRHQQAHDRRLRAVERTLSEQREEAGLGRAAAAIAHDIRNPLNTMGMGLQRLEMEVPDLDPEHWRLLTLIRGALKRTDATVHGLLDYARPYQPERRPLLLDELVREQLEPLRERIEPRNIVCSSTLQAAGRIAADPNLLIRLLDNLLRNALEALPDGGHLTIVSSPVADGVLLQVDNDGLALTDEQLRKVLDPWFTTKTDGTGLGLAICRRIAAAHGGELSVSSPRPGWFRVAVFLPDGVD